MSSLKLRFPSNQHCTEVIMCGYLFKSPPMRELKKKELFFHGLACTGGTSKFFKKRWRERYCVLYKVRSRDKTEIFFEYYKDSHCTKLKGQVDLKNCDCIIDDDNSDEKWPNVFSVQTVHNGQKRVYYFSAPSAQNMSDWVRYLVDVTGFVVTVQPDYPSPISGPPHGTQPGWGSRRMKPLSTPSCPNPFHTVSGSVNSGWLAETATRHVQGAQSDCSEDGYREPGAAGLEYLLSGPEDEQDAYYKVPGLSHSYVNLPTATVGDEDSAQRVHHSRSQPSVATSNTGAHAESAHRRLSNHLPSPLKHPFDANGVSNFNSEFKVCLTKPDQHSGNSDNSLYFNVWEAGNGDGTDYTLDSVMADTINTETGTLPEISGNQRAIPRPNTRVYRRSKVMSEYHQLPMALPTAFTPNPMADSAPLPARKIATTPRPVPHQNMSSAALSPLPIPVHHREASTALELSPIDVDLALPVRVPGSHSPDDSSLESRSVTSKSMSNADMTIDESRVVVCDSNDYPLEPAPVPPIPLEKEAPEGMSTSNKITCEPILAGSSHAAPSLNYIEPCNLDLGALPSNAHSRSSVSTGRLTTDIPLYKQPVDTRVPCSGSDTCPNRVPAVDDYKIEYREIDPIGTSALAVVAKRYLDADLTA